MTNYFIQQNQLLIKLNQIPNAVWEAELIKFAQTQSRNKDITIKFDKPKALYTTLTYKGPTINNMDLEKILPEIYNYAGADFEKK